MRLPKSWTKVTPLSRMVALVMFTTLPILAFAYGMRYQQMLTAAHGGYCVPAVNTRVNSR